MLPARLSRTALVYVQHNRYSAPVEYAHKVVSVRIYPDELAVAYDGRIVSGTCAALKETRCVTTGSITFLLSSASRERRATVHRSTICGNLSFICNQFLKHAGGDRVMAQVLVAVPEHGLDAVQVAADLALESGRPSAEHVLNVLARLKGISFKCESTVYFVVVLLSRI